LRDAPDSALVVTPIEMEPEHLYVVLGCLLDIGNRNLWNSVGKVGEHVFQPTPIWSTFHLTRHATRALIAPSPSGPQLDTGRQRRFEGASRARSQGHLAPGPPTPRYSYWLEKFRVIVQLMYSPACAFPGKRISIS